MVKKCNSAAPNKASAESIKAKIAKQLPKCKALFWFMLLAAVIFTVSIRVIWLGDDIDYGFFISDSIWNSSGRITSITQFFASQGNHYWYVNGRTVAHALVQLFCGVAGQAAFAVANALIYCAFIYLILKICGVHRIFENEKAVVTCIVLVLITFITKMMPTTQIGFVWMFTLNLLWLRSFFNRRITSKLSVIGICLLGLLAGNGQEALTLGMSAALGLWWLHRRCRIGGARTAMLFCYWLGTLAICCSPGTLGRAKAMDLSFAQSMLYMAMSLRATYMLIIALAILKFRKKLSLKCVYRQNALLINTMLIMLLVNIVIGVYCNRQLFGLELMAILVLLRTLPHSTFGKSMNFWAILVVCDIVTLQWMGIQHVRREYTEIEQLYKSSDKGMIFYDRTLASTNIFMREYRYYEEIVGQFNNDTHHSLQKEMIYKYPGKRALHVWPTYIEGRRAVTDTIVEYAPQHYFVVITDRGNKQTVMHCNGDTTQLQIVKSAVNGAGWRSLIVVPHTPFTPIDSLTQE